MNKFVFLLFLVLIGVAPVRGGESPRVDPRLLEVQRRMNGVGQIAGTFVQEKKLEYLRDPVVSSGRFFFNKPDSLNWEYVSPAPSGMKIERGEATVWNGPPGARVNQPGAMSRAAKMMAEQVMMWMNFRPAEILAVYDVTVAGDSPLTVRVVPRREGLRKHLKSITVVLDADGMTVRSVSLEENEAVTLLTFDNVLFDQGPPPGMTE